MPRRDPVDDHLHQRADQRLFAALIAREELGGEGAIPHLRYTHRQRPHPRGELPRLVPVAIPASLGGALIRLRLHVRGPRHLRLQHLGEDLFEQMR